MLKSLELFGFKSFADKTVFEFHDGITGVVGPNGSGKSNVVDSIKWLLGDQSAKSLRGKEMTDVIFNGSTSRGGAQFAEATLVFDNTTRFLPLDHDEVSVGRRLWKTGDSEYLINRQAARLKDVRDLLTGTGAGAASYCIIEQGRVDQILQSNAANRRLIFEEAAGISRLKQRRNEAERRLERVEQNLLRLTDIVDEVESQVDKVRSQAEKATKYRKISTELETFWVGMVADDFRRQSMVREKLEQQKSTASQHLSDVQQSQAAAKLVLDEADEALSVVDDELREVEGHRSELRSRMASLQTTLGHHSSRRKELEIEVDRLVRQQTLMDGRVAEAEREEIHLQSVLKLEHERCEEHQRQKEDGLQGLQDLKASLQELAAEATATKTALAKATQEESDLTNSLGGLRHELRSLEKRSEELLDAKIVLDSELEQLRAREEESERALSEALAAQKTTEEQADQILNQRESLLSQQTESRESLADLREQRSAVLARKTVLEDLEDRQEGYGIGAREILRRAEEDSRQPWNLIQGSVADLLDVDMQNAALLEVALSGRAQLLVIDELEPLVSYLNSGKCQITGRVGFVSLKGFNTGRSGSAFPDALHSNSEQDRLGSGDLGQVQASDEPQDLLNREKWSLSDIGVFDENWLNADFDLSVGEEFVPDLKVTWVDEHGNIPVIRSVFSLPDASINSLQEEEGVVGRADSLARSPRHIPALASLLLADTWVVRSLDHARRLRDKYGSTYRFITLQGELIEKDGVLFTGTVRSEAAVVSRKSELRRLKNELHRVEHLINERDLRLKNLVRSIESTDTELQASREHVEHCSAATSGARQQHGQAKQAVEASLENENKLDQQVQRLADGIEQLQSQEDRLQQQQTEAVDGRRQLQLSVSEIDQRQNDVRVQLQALEQGRTEANLSMTRSEERLLSIRDAVERLIDDLEQRRLQQQESRRRLTSGQGRLQELLLRKLNVAAELFEQQIDDDQLTLAVMNASQARSALRGRRQEATKAEQHARETCRAQETLVHEVELQINSIQHQLQTSAERIQDEFSITVEEAVENGRSAVVASLMEQQESKLHAGSGQETDGASADDYQSSSEVDELYIDDPSVQQVLRSDERYGELRESVDQRVGKLKRQLKKLGNVGTESLDNLTELETRFQRLDAQLKDLEAARDALRDMVRQINFESRRMFEESFATIRENFRDLFRRLFGGGEADLVLEDPEDILECSIDVVARPPGKELRGLSLLSGGEKTMTAVGLLLSIFQSRPSPFCILDEVDAALDDANIGRFVNVLKGFKDETQFIMITHRKPTMVVTDALYGVTMEESGVSKRLAVKFEDIDDHGNYIGEEDQASKAA
ncbi:MAG: AAA family ATPase [Fuerstiella sp.]